MQWAFIHALLPRVPFALAGLSCIIYHLPSNLLLHDLVKLECLTVQTLIHITDNQGRNYRLGLGRLNDAAALPNADGIP